MTDRPVNEGHEDQEARIEALAEKGWVLVHADESQVIYGDTVSVFKFERQWQGSQHSIIHHSLEKAIELCEQEEVRISALPDGSPKITTGVASDRDVKNIRP